MAGPTISLNTNRSIKLFFCFFVAGLTVTAVSQLAFAQPKQWQQEIERPLANWDYNGKQILGHIGHDICLWDATSGKLLHKMSGHKENIRSVQFNPDGNHAFSCSWSPRGILAHMKSKDTQVIIWDLTTGENKRSFKHQIAEEFSPDGERLITFTTTAEERSYNTATIWDTYTGQQIVKVKIRDGGPRWDTLKFSPDGSSFFLNGRSLIQRGGGSLYSAINGRILGGVARSDMEAGGHRYLRNGALATCGNKRARLIDIKTGKTLENVEHDLKKGEFRLSSIWTHTGSKVIAISPLQKTRILDMKSGKIVEMAAPDGDFHRAVVSPDDSVLAVVHFKRENHKRKDNCRIVQLYEINTGKKIAEFELEKLKHKIIGFSPDSKTFLISCPKFTIYNSKNGKKIRTLTLEGEPIK